MLSSQVLLLCCCHFLCRVYILPISFWGCDFGGMPACQVNVLEDASWTLAKTIQDCCRAPYCYSLRVASVSPSQAACWFKVFVLTEYFAELSLHSSDNAVWRNVDFPDACGPTTSIQGVLWVFWDQVKMLRIFSMWSFFPFCKNKKDTDWTCFKAPIPGLWQHHRKIQKLICEQNSCKHLYPSSSLPICCYSSHYGPGWQLGWGWGVVFCLVFGNS